MSQGPASDKKLLDILRNRKMWPLTRRKNRSVGTDLDITGIMKLTGKNFKTAT